MGLNIKNPEVQRLARLIAQETGTTLTGAIEAALREKLERLHLEDDAAQRHRELREMIERLPPAPPGFTSDHSDLYDEDGLFA